MVGVEALGEPSGLDWQQIAGFGIAFGLSALIGLERELKQRAAGIRTYTVVGVGTALFVLMSKYGFTDVLSPGGVVLDPSRVAAQIVSGLGFIGGGIIFVKRDVVRGLTTAASIWMTAAVAATATAGLPVLAVVGTVAYFLAILFLPVCARLVAKLAGTDRRILLVSYVDGMGLLRDMLEAVTQSGFAVARIATTRRSQSSDLCSSERGMTDGSATTMPGIESAKALERTVSIQVLLDGRGNLDTLTSVLNEIAGVLGVDTGVNPKSDTFRREDG